MAFSDLAMQAPMLHWTATMASTRKVQVVVAHLSPRPLTCRLPLVAPPAWPLSSETLLKVTSSPLKPLTFQVVVRKNILTGGEKCVPLKLLSSGHQYMHALLYEIPRRTSAPSSTIVCTSIGDSRPRVCVFLLFVFFWGSLNRTV